MKLDLIGLIYELISFNNIIGGHGQLRLPVILVVIHVVVQVYLQIIAICCDLKLHKSTGFLRVIS